MSRIREHLTGIARRNARVYARDRRCRVVALAGSLSRGKPHRYSDIDTIILYDDVPSLDELERAAGRNRGEHWRVIGHNRDGVVEHYFVSGVECQFAHGRLAWYDATFKQVLEDFSLDRIAHTVMSGLGDAQALHGARALRAIQKRIAAYPRGLAAKMVTEHLAVPGLDPVRRRMLKRDSLIWFHEVLLDMQRKLLGMLFGLNRMYLPGEFKKIDQLTARMTIKPRRLFPRLVELHELAPEDALVELGELVLETYALIETHLPEIDVAEARTRFTRRLTPIRIPK